MATTSVAAFIAAKKTQLAALMDGGSKVFNSVWIGPNVDIDRVLPFNRTPMAIISDQGGTLQRPNGKVWDRILGVTVVCNRPRDPVGQKSALDLIAKGELLIAELNNDRDDSGIFCYSDSEEFMIPTETANLFVAKTWYFRYSIELA